MNIDLWSADVYLPEKPPWGTWCQWSPLLTSLITTTNTTTITTIIITSLWSWCPPSRRTPMSQLSSAACVEIAWRMSHLIDWCCGCGCDQELFYIKVIISWLVTITITMIMIITSCWSFQPTTHQSHNKVDHDNHRLLIIPRPTSLTPPSASPTASKDPACRKKSCKKAKSGFILNWIWAREVPFRLPTWELENPLRKKTPDLKRMR